MIGSSAIAQEDELPIETEEIIEISDIKPDEHYRALVINVLKEFDAESPYQKVQLKILNGEEIGRQIIIEHGKDYNLLNNQLVETGDQILLVKSYGFETSYRIAEPYRLNAVFYIILLFLITVFCLIRWRGIMSLLGLGFSILVIIKFIIPQILNGHNPLLISFVGAVIIATLSLYLAHGFKKRTTIALISTLVTIIIALIFAVIFVNASHLFGMGTEEAFVLQLGLSNLNLKGLLLGGILIGALGILDDVTTTQTAAVEEIYKANPELSAKQLYKKGYSVGKEHMISMINTLALAYIGAAFPMFILFYINKDLPLWVLINSELIVEEIMRTLAGSFALIVAIPISTGLATYYFKKAK